MAPHTLKRVVIEPEVTGEKVMSRIWERQRLKAGLKTTDGEPVQVVFPGRRNGLGGPDFRQAIVISGRRELRGDVELHLRSSLWRAHGHHRDPAYDNVVLHVVMWDDALSLACLHSGRSIPTLTLGAQLLGRRQMPPDGPSNDHSGPTTLPAMGSLAAALDGLGERRFLAKAGKFRAKLGPGEPGQVLYEGVMVALGYSRNGDAFREMACRLPLAEAEAVVRAGGLEAIRSLALARSGLAPSAGGDLPAIPWQRQGIRPGNQPARRIEALCHLLFRYARNGWLKGLMEIVQGATKKEPGWQRQLEEALIVASTGGAPGAGQPALLGRARAGDIVVNVLLPFAHACGLTDDALGLYRGYASLEGNGITREMSAQLGIGPKEVSSACRQQGLIHLFKGHCVEKKCDVCPLGELSFLCSGSILPADRGRALPAQGPVHLVM